MIGKNHNVVELNPNRRRWRCLIGFHDEYAVHDSLFVATYKRCRFCPNWSNDPVVRRKHEMERALWEEHIADPDWPQPRWHLPHPVRWVHEHIHRKKAA